MAGYTVGLTSTPALADPPAAIADGLAQWFGYLGDLNNKGPFATDLTGTTLDVGGANGLDLAGLTAEAVTHSWRTATSPAAVATALDGMDGTFNGWTYTTTATASTPTAGQSAVHVDLQVSKTINTGFGLHDPAHSFDLTSGTGLRTQLGLHSVFTAITDDTSHAFWIARTPTDTPSLSVHVAGDVPNLSAVDGGLGILGVTFGPGSTFSLTGDITTAFADPNGDGKLAFAEPGGSDGELASTGSAGGVASPTVAPGGVLDGHLVLAGRTSSLVNGLPDVSATVDVHSSDLAGGNITATFDPHAFDAVAPFLTMGTKDLADTLAQMASVLGSSEHARDQILPLLHGNLSDAILSEESIVGFLKHYVQQPPAASDDNPAHLLGAGHPTFGSIQDLATDLNNFTDTDVPGYHGTGAHIGLGDARYIAPSDPGNASHKPKLLLTLQLSHHATTDQPLDVRGPALTSDPAHLDQVTFGDDFLRDGSHTFTADVAGRQVTSGASTALIDHVDAADAHKLVLSTTPFIGITPQPTSLWQGSTPTGHQSYSVAGADPRTGQVEFGNALDSTTGLGDANGAVPQATFKPQYDVTLPIVLDLEPFTPLATPQTVTNPDGTASVVTGHPTVPERIMLRTGGTLVSADLPISTSIDVPAHVGFLEVKLGGSLQLCTDAAGVNADCTGSPSDGTHFFSLSTIASGDADHDLALPDVFSTLAQHPANLVDAHVHGRAAASVDFSVPGSSSFFSGGHVTGSLHWDNISDPSTLHFTAPDLTALSKLKSFDISGLDDPTKLLGALLQGLQAVDQQLHASGAGSSAFDTKIPMLGKSVHDLLGSVEQGGPGAQYGASTLTDPARDFTGYEGRTILVGSTAAAVTGVSGAGNHVLTVTPAWGTTPANDTPYAIGDSLLAALSQVAANPSSTLNDLVAVLKTRLGNAVDFTVVPATSTDPAMLKLIIDWQQQLPLRIPLDFKLNSADLPSDIIGTSGSGTLNITANAGLHLGVLYPLTAAAVADPLTNLKISGDSTAHVTADVGLSPDFTFTANLGPLALSVGDPTSGHTPGTALQAHLGFNLSPGSSDAQSLPSFFTGLTPAADNHTPATCAGISSPDTLAACANLPLFFRDNGGNWQPIGTGVKVHIPQSHTPSQFAGDVELPDSAAILSALESQLIDLSTLGDGLAGYMRLLDAALQLADTAGKIPVVGPDIQQGLNFIGQIRDAITQVLPVDTSFKVHSSSEIQAKLDQIASNIDVPVNPHFHVATDCSATLVAPVAAAGGQTGPGSDTPVQDWKYRVIAFYNGTARQYSPASNELTFHNAAPSSASGHVHSNPMTWGSVTFADGYLVERLDPGSSTWKQLKVLNGNATGSYTDNGADTPAAAPSGAPSSSPPTLVPCPGNAINGFLVKVVIGQGNPSPAHGCEDAGSDTCATATSRPLDLGLPGLSLSTADPNHPNDLSNPANGVSASIGWRLHLSFGLTKDHGFVVYTQDNDSDPASPDASDSTPELVVGAALSGPENFNGRLAFLAVKAHGADAAQRGLNGQFSLDLHAPGDAACGDTCTRDLHKVLTISDIQNADLSQLLTAKLSAAVHLHYTVTVLADEALPGIRSDFYLDWAWDSGHHDTSDTHGLNIGFNDVRINPGKFLGSVLQPIFDKINMIYSPIKPVLDTIAAPLPVLSDLSHLVGGGDVSVLTLAATFAESGTDPGTFDEFVNIFKSVKTVLDALNHLTSACSGGDESDYENDANFCIHLGDFTVLGGPAFNVQSTPDTADSLLGTTTPSADGSLFDQLNGKVGGAFSGVNNDAAASGSKNACGAGADDRGFTFTALKQPSSLFGLLLGKDVELICFDSGPITLGFTFSEAFGPVYAPPPVLVVVSGSAGVTAHIAAGFDTYGIRKAVEDSDAGLSTRGVEFLDSLYFKTTDTEGHPIPVIQFFGELAAGAEVSAVIISVGVEGGIRLTVSFYWNDPDNDGKFRFTEFLTTALNNPICLFNVGGELSLFLKVFVTIGFSPFSVSFDFTLVNITLLDFSIKPDCTPPPPELAGKDDSGTLYLFAGRLGTGANRGHDTYDNRHDPAHPDKEKVIVRQHKDDAHTVTVSMLGITEDFGGVNAVVLDGKDYGGPIQALFQGSGDQTAAAAGDASANHDSPFTLPTYIHGGTNDDVIKTGTGPAYITGGGGNDQITTGDRPDLAGSEHSVTVAGGDGADALTVGNADDAVYGDGDLVFGDVPVTAHRNNSRGDVGISSLSIANPQPPSDPDTGTGNDRISAGLGHDDLFGGGGDDIIGVASDSPLAAAHTGADHASYVSRSVTVHGGPGSDRITAGTGDDKIFTGGTFNPAPLTEDQIADRQGTLDGGSAVNTVDTGAGSDKVYGSDGQDFVTGHSASSPSPATKDTLFGSGGQDVLMGADGKDRIFGGPGDDYLLAELSTVGDPGSTADVLGNDARTVVHNPNANAPQEKLLVGGGGRDRIFGGDGGAKIYGDHRDFTCSDNLGRTPASSPPDESGVISTGDPAIDDANDLIIGGEGVDDVNAGGGNDNVTAKGNADLVCGSKGNDTIDAGNGTDTVWGGTDNDLVYGSDGADSLFGNADVDTIYGGNQNDTIEGNNGKDTLFGGSNDDLVVGGTQAAGKADNDPGHVGDTLFGDTGNDLLVGDNGTAGAADNPSGRRVALVYDLDSTDAALGEGDHLYGGDGADSGYGGLANDAVDGGDANDYLEGNPGTDTITGDAGADNIAGGSSQLPGGNPAAKDAAGYPDAGDVLSGGTDDDVIIGDDGQISDTTLGAADPVMKGRSLTAGRHVVLYDLGYSPAAGNSGADAIAGNDANDVIFGQGAVDTIHGNSGADYLEGGQAGDLLFGDAGEDDITGGSLYGESGTGQATAGQLDTGDTISGGDDADVILGDNGLVTRDPAVTPSAITRGRYDSDAFLAAPMTLRSIQPFDLGDSPTANTSGGDLITGDNGSDAILGQSGNDRILGGNDGDYAEGDPGRDWVEGNAGDDDLLGGASTILGTDTGQTSQGQPDVSDVVFGGTGDDLITGDNAVTDRSSAPSPYVFRVGSSGALETQRSLRLLDLRWGSPDSFLNDPTRPVSGGDQLAGGSGVDVIFGQDGADLVSGGADDDYAEGNGGHDTIYGDRTFGDLGITLSAPTPTWPGSPSGDVDSSTPNGQDDLIGGSSIQAFRDTADDVHGDGAADFVLGDNGTSVRDIVDNAGQLVPTVAAASGRPLPLVDRIYTKRYPASVPAGAAYVRHGTSSTSPTRFCVGTGTTCEPALAAGADFLWGDAGQDTVYGQDGADHIYGDTGSQAKPDAGSPAVVNDGGGISPLTANDDDLYGELGNDIMWGEFGDDAMLGDRGGIVDQYQDGSNHFVIDNSQVPKIHYDGFLAGAVTRVVDNQHDVNGDSFMGASGAAAMPHRGDLEGGDDVMRGGVAHDSMHGSFGDDLMNGDSGGDTMFGDDGADIMWGGKGSDDQTNLADRGVNDSLVDYMFGGKGGATDGTKKGILGADILDWRPRGSYGTPGPATCAAGDVPQDYIVNKKATTTVDPCSWFEMTDLTTASTIPSQHHQGIDWMYGGWDRDVLQADNADNGPNSGDRLLDWNGAYNLYTHCNSAYGGYNDVRQHSPTQQDFLQRWSYSIGAGQALGDLTTEGTSAFDELALVYPGKDNDHGSGPAFPGTPGHFDEPNACAP